MIMKTYKDIITEMSTAGKGNWIPDNDTIGSYSKRIINLSYKKIDNIKIKDKLFELYKLKSESKIKHYFILGSFINEEENGEIVERFDCVMEMELKDIKTKIPEINNVKVVESVIVKETSRGYGISTTIYKYLVKELKYLIIGDSIQYFGARMLWKKLSKDKDVVVDLIDLKQKRILEKDVTLYHGDKDWEFDKRLWSYKTGKEHIRPILKDIL